MRLTPEEKEFLRKIVEQLLVHYKKDRKRVFVEVFPLELKAEHEYEEFLLNLGRKLKK